MKEPAYYVSWPNKEGGSSIFNNQKAALAYAEGGPLVIAKNAEGAVKIAYGKRPTTEQAAKANRKHFEEQDRAFHAKRFTHGALIRKNHGHT